MEITTTAISDEEFNSELELLKSLEVIKGVVTDLDLVNNQTPTQDTWLSKKRIELKLELAGLLGRDPAGKDRGTEGSSLDLSLEQAVNRVEGNLDVVPVKKSRVIKITYTDTSPFATLTLDAVYKLCRASCTNNEKLNLLMSFMTHRKFNEKLDDATGT